MSIKPPSVLLQHLYMVRAQVDLAIAAAEADLPQPIGCDHPLEARLDATTGGGPPRFLCRVCEQEIDGIA